MSDVAIRVEGLSKRYLIGERLGYLSLRDAIMNKVERLKPGAEKRSREGFWALDDVSFDVKHGEVLGVVGSNGAGKSTLLKILSQITEPSRGRATIYGRVGSLLEVGTGFHPELTGRENIYFNGSILGMRKHEIDQKFDEIVEFAEVEKFLETPVKHYSSGMRVRLAFAVAAHLDPEILIIDEVLAVGDAAFQKKCLGKMSDVAQEGRTILFVSHNMAMVNKLCHSGILMERGRVTKSGTAEEITAEYLQWTIAPLPGDSAYYQVNRTLFETQLQNDVRITGITLINDRDPGAPPRTGDPLLVKLEYEAPLDTPIAEFIIVLKDAQGGEIIRLNTALSGFPIDRLFARGVAEIRIDTLPLVGGTFFMSVGAFRYNVGNIVILDDAVQMEVQAVDMYKSGHVLTRSQGIIHMRHSWAHNPAEAE